MADREGPQRNPLSIELQNGSSKRKFVSKPTVAPRKRQQAEFSFARLLTDRTCESSAFPSSEVERDATEFSEDCTAGKALDTLFKKVSKENKTHNKGEFAAALKAFGRANRITPTGTEKWLLKGTKIPLFHHQLLSVGWMLGIEANAYFKEGRPRGGVLADEMGLGKTLQIITLIVSSRARYGSGGTTLVVVPSTILVAQFLSEIEKHLETTSDITTFCYANRSLMSDDYLVTYFQRFDIVITTYSMLQQSSRKSGPLHRLALFRAVFDEGHVLKNHKSANFAAASSLQARYKWISTGTPITNGLDELYSYCHLLQVDGLQDIRKFRKFLKDDSKQDFSQLRQRTGNFMLRRTKRMQILGRSIIELPSTRYESIHVSLGKYEQVLANQIMEGIRKEIRACIKQMENDVSRVGNSTRKHDVDQVKQTVLKLISILRQAVGNPLLVWKELPNHITTEVESLSLVKELTHLNGWDPTVATKQQWSARLLVNPMFGENESRSEAKLKGCQIPVSRWFNAGGLVLYSAKLKAAHGQIRKWISADAGQKILIFTQFLDMVYIIEQMCKDENWCYDTYTGKMSDKRRDEAITRLNEDKDMKILIMTSKSGGVGLNLSAASRVLIFDLWWNCAAEEQAQSRIERIGQKSEMEIVRLIAKSTIDEKVISIQNWKASQIDAVMQGKDLAAGSRLRTMLGLDEEEHSDNDNELLSGIFDDLQTGEIEETEEAENNNDGFHPDIGNDVFESQEFLPFEDLRSPENNQI